MAERRIENDRLRYALSFLAVLTMVVLGVAAAMALPESVPNHDLVGQGLILGGGLVGLYVMLWIEEGPAPLRRRVRDLLR